MDDSDFVISDSETEEGPAKRRSNSKHENTASSTNMAPIEFTTDELEILNDDVYDEDEEDIGDISTTFLLNLLLFTRAF